MPSVVFPEADVKEVYFATSDNSTDYGFVVPSLMYPDGYPPSENILKRFDQNVDIIFAPIRSEKQRGLILLKRVWFRFSKDGDPINATLKIYTKGNEPKDDSTDAPDQTINFQIKNGDVILDTNHLLSEAFVLRLEWSPDVSVGDKVINSGTAFEAYNIIHNRVRLQAMFVDIEEYGDPNSVIGDEYEG
jgi:hypothetical protein